MQWTHVRNADLNLLLALHFLIEERQVKRAADRFGLSQPAMSRVLQRLRDTFGDELLIRTREGYEPTLRAQRIHSDLRDILSRLETMLREGAFDPLEAVARFTVVGSDYSAFIQGPALSRLIRERAPNISLELVAFTDDAFADMERGRVDLMLWVDEVPPPLVSEPLFMEDYVCVVDPAHPLLGEGLTLDSYFRQPHVVVTIVSGRQPLLDARLDRLGGRRDARLKVPYFAAAIDAVPGTDLIATVPKRFALPQVSSGQVAILPAPPEIKPIQYLMAWHPRLTDDPAHTWLRSIVKESASGV